MFKIEEATASTLFLPATLMRLLHRRTKYFTTSGPHSSIEIYTKYTAAPTLLNTQSRYNPSALLPFVFRETGRRALAIEKGTS